jgi:predicted nucleotidyltransferase
MKLLSKKQIMMYGYKCEYCEGGVEFMTDVVAEQFAQLVRQKLKDHVKKIILFGSYARGDFSERSDRDILIIVDKRNKQTQELVLDVSVEIMNRYYALVGSIVCDEQEWENKKWFPIGLNILKEGIEL